MNAFTSRYDAYLARTVDLNDMEREGLRLFNGKGKCRRCHTCQPRKGELLLFTDYSFDNLGVPRSPRNAALAWPASDRRTRCIPIKGFCVSAGTWEFDCLLSRAIGLLPKPGTECICPP